MMDDDTSKYTDDEPAVENAAEKAFRSVFSDPDVDVDEHAAMIKESAMGALEVILNRRAALDAEGRADEPLVVLAGEVHEFPVYTMHHMVLLTELAKREPDLLSLSENPYDIVPIQFEKTALTILEPEQKHELFERSLKDPRFLMQVQRATTFSFYSPVANALYLNMLAKHGIYHAFNDCSFVNEGDVIDMTDSRAQKAFATVAGQPHKVEHLSGHFSVSGERRFGIEMRNWHMVQMTMEIARARKSRIIYQRVGADHLIGNDADGLRYRNSMTEMYRDVLGVPVAVIYPTIHGYDANEEITMEAANLGEDELYCIDNVPLLSAIYHPQGRPLFLTDLPPVSYEIDILEAYEEAEYVNTVLDRMGYPELYKSWRAICDEQNEMKDEVIATFRDWAYEMGFEPF